ncbi:hypothetical protein CLOSBL3_12192 [Clostridiaceae bacterium BL-3]|nr:hypothetical protein CLOSBL3_12192 [Clostridiaceae bacterium BL-3]
MGCIINYLEMNFNENNFRFDIIGILYSNFFGCINYLCIIFLEWCIVNCELNKMYLKIKIV